MNVKLFTIEVSISDDGDFEVSGKAQIDTPLTKYAMAKCTEDVGKLMSEICEDAGQAEFEND